MKLVRFGSAGAERPGIMDSSGNIRDISAVVPDLGGEYLSPAWLARIAALDLTSLPVVDSTARIGACVARPVNFIAIGLNYADHAAETGAAIPAEPVIFTKAPNCIVGPNDDVMLPRGSVRGDWEVELAVVIGRRASYVDVADAPNYIAGYCVCNDVSERVHQFERGGQWSKGKSAATFGPLGPWLVTPDEVPNVGSLSLWLDLNGKRMQSGTTGTMVFSVYEIVAYVSQFFVLEPGDVITTGTPPGVGLGQKPPVYLKAGDTMQLGIDGLGTQQQRVIAWAP
ncbi:MAG: fumarylacetoacetate hydrolase family protein [Gemmatimonas sp.]